MYHSAWLANNVQTSDPAPQMCRLQSAKCRRAKCRCADVQTCRRAELQQLVQSCRTADVQTCRCAELQQLVQMSPEPTTKDAAPTTKNALNPWYQHLLAVGQYAEQHKTARQHYQADIKLLSNIIGSDLWWRGLGHEIALWLQINGNDLTNQRLAIHPHYNLTSLAPQVSPRSENVSKWFQF